MAAGVVHIQWYATLLRSDLFADMVAEEAAPAALRHGATRVSVQRSRDDMYRITQMAWFNDKDDWYRYWEGREMIEFRARYSNKFQVPVTYVWHDELIFKDAPTGTVELGGTPDTSPAIV